MRNVMKKMVLPMAALALLEDLANGAIRRERVFREREDLLANDDNWLKPISNISKSYILLEICTELGPGLERQTARSHALPVPIQVLTTLGFLATGSFQRELADRHIRFPYDAVNQAHIKAQFAEIAGFPNVIGAIDCTHIAIKAPSEGEYAYVNRKHFHSLNVQIICDAQMRLTNIVARWPGSTHDSFVLLTNSSVGNRLEPGSV
ncbi:putative nuclease HARBI1 [Merluccius polli]|uniref:Nuclease HARBI1 n=1 Tax=Merluccius polli TaxID=89951 RepID=A0AA47P1T2_MERPO|nr:putative nuclease HARBI1 [Merluccius polli]